MKCNNVQQFLRLSELPYIYRVDIQSYEAFAYSDPNSIVYDFSVNIVDDDDVSQLELGLWMLGYDQVPLRGAKNNWQRPAHMNRDDFLTSSQAFLSKDRQQ
jgi:hypothetical protein